jgi:hypothetical protein
MTVLAQRKIEPKASEKKPMGIWTKIAIGVGILLFAGAYIGGQHLGLLGKPTQAQTVAAKPAQKLLPASPKRNYVSGLRRCVDDKDDKCDQGY